MMKEIGSFQSNLIRKSTIIDIRIKKIYWRLNHHQSRARYGSRKSKQNFASKSRLKSIASTQSAAPSTSKPGSRATSCALGRLQSEMFSLSANDNILRMRLYTGIAQKNVQLRCIQRTIRITWRIWTQSQHSEERIRHACDDHGKSSEMQQLCEGKQNNHDSEYLQAYFRSPPWAGPVEPTWITLDFISIIWIVSYLKWSKI